MSHSINQFYAKTHHKQNMKWSVSTAWKVTAIFDVMTLTMNGAACSSCNSNPLYQFQSLPKDVKKYLLTLSPNKRAFYF